MNSRILFTSVSLCAFTVSERPIYAQNDQKSAKEIVVPMKPEAWEFKEGQVLFAEHKGKVAMKISPEAGHVVLKGVLFKNGIIEYDYYPIPSNTVSGQSTYFRGKTTLMRKYCI